MLKDVIVAIATPLAAGAISNIRLSGEGAVSLANELTKKDLTKMGSHTIGYTHIIHPTTKQLVDEVLVSVFLAPKTYTREDVVEINCHGGVYVTKEILALCLAKGARLAAPGEFTQRAFLNGRIDLTQAEAVQDLIDAKSDVHVHLAMQELKGSIHSLLNPLIEQILDIIAVIEVNIDYPEYDDVVEMSETILLPKIEDWLRKIELILKQSKQGKVIREGIQTAIVGKPNAGKSSLLNALLEEEKAIVTDIAGTTRDIVEGEVHVGDVLLHLIDTAGIRETDSVIEQMGIERSRKAMEEADLVLQVIDGRQREDEEDDELWALAANKQRIKVYNKQDLSKREDGIQISALEQNIDSLKEEIQHRFEHNYKALQAPTLANERQISLMMKADFAMRQARQAMSDGLELDVVEIDIQEAYTALKEILGKVYRDDLLDTLFSKFCLGK